MWNCAACGVPSPDRVRSCDCITNVVTDRSTGASEWKRRAPVSAKAEREFRSFHAAWREKHSPTSEQEIELIERVFDL
jgi:hypothetical protein